MNSKRPFFSVIIPTFNRRSLVLEAIRSVLNQESKDFEIIVVDDGSTDGTSEAVESLDSSIQVIRQPTNTKRGIARNRGAQESRGRFMIFLDDDDLFEPSHLSRFEAAASSSGYLAFSSGAAFWDPTSGRTRPFVRSARVGRDLRQATLLGTALPLPSLAIAREVVAESGAFPESRALDGSEDFVFLVRLASCTNIMLLDEPTLRIREHPGRGMKKLDEIIGSRKAAMQLLLDEGLPTGPLTAGERELLVAGTARFCSALYYEGLRPREARAELRTLRQEMGWWKGLRLGGRLWLLSLFGGPSVKLGRRVKASINR